MADYSTLPSGATLKPKPYKAYVPEEKLQLLKDLVKISPIAAPTFENTNAGRHFGMEREWLIKAKEEWTTSFDWRKQEDRINSFPNFIVSIKDDQGIEPTSNSLPYSPRRRTPFQSPSTTAGLAAFSSS
jgi:microsomal epoxide hydrolase